MWFLSNISLRWAVALIVPVLFVLLAGTWLTAKRLTDDLLKKDATEDARAWAEFFAANVPDLEQIAAGEGFSAALRQDGTIFTWGKNDEGQLGRGKGPDSATPTEATLHHEPFFFRGDQQDWASSPLCNLQQGRLFTASFRSLPRRRGRPLGT